MTLNRRKLLTGSAALALAGALPKDATGLSKGRLIAAILGKGVGDTIVVNGIVYELLYGADNQPLQGADSQYLYGLKRTV